jgi:hypothetical protein
VSTIKEEGNEGDNLNYASLGKWRREIEITNKLFMARCGADKATEWNSIYSKKVKFSLFLGNIAHLRKFR